MAACRAGSRCSSQVDGASEQPSGAGSSSLLASATTWPLKRYGRFLSPTDKEDGERSDRSWQVTVWGRPPLCVGMGRVSVLLS